MKRLLLVFTLLAVFLVPSMASAAELIDPINGTYEETEFTYPVENTTIDKVWYSQDWQCYVATTAPDESGYNWTLALLYADKEDKTFIAYLKKYLTGKKVEVTYDGQGTDDPEYWQIVSFKLKAAK
jgi:hypothetical protein